MGLPEMGQNPQKPIKMYIAFLRQTPNAGSTWPVLYFMTPRHMTLWHALVLHFLCGVGLVINVSLDVDLLQIVPATDITIYSAPQAK